MPQSIYSDRKETFAMRPSPQYDVVVIYAGFRTRLQIHCECVNLEICSGFRVSVCSIESSPGDVEIENLQNKQKLQSNAPKPQRCGDNSQMGMKPPLLSQALDCKSDSRKPSGVVVSTGVLLLLNRRIGILIDVFGLDNLVVFLLVAIGIILLLVDIGILLFIVIGVIIHSRSQGLLLLLRQGFWLASRPGLGRLLLDLGGAFDWAALGADAADSPAEGSLDLAEADTGCGGVVVAGLAGHGVPVDLWGC